MEGEGGRGVKREEEGYDLCLLPFTPRVTVILYLLVDDATRISSSLLLGSYFVDGTLWLTARSI